MSKKKSKHKHTRSSRKSQVQPKVAASSVPVSDSAVPLAAAPAPLASPKSSDQPKPGVLDSTNRWYYVRGDMRRIGVLASLCIGLELILWYVLVYSPLGDSIYQLINI